MKTINTLKQLGYGKEKEDYSFKLWDEITKQNKLSNTFIRRYKMYLDVKLVLDTQKHINDETIIAILWANYNRTGVKTVTVSGGQA